jgi:hypothetical protein
MLGKLLKYDMKAGFRMIPVTYLAIAAFYLLGLVAKALKISQLLGSATFLLVIAGIAAVILTLVFIIFRFHKGIFGAEGYLTQTLPVGKGSIILSKVITAYLWMVFSIVAAILAVIAVLHLNDVKELNKLIDYLFGSSFTPFVVFIVVTGFIQLLAYIGELYFAMTLANTRPFIRSNVLLSIVFFFAANMAVGFLEILAMLFIPLGLRITESGVVWTTETMMGSLFKNGNIFAASEPPLSEISIGIGSGFADLAAGIAFLLIARWLLTHKTSVK